MNSLRVYSTNNNFNYIFKASYLQFQTTAVVYTDKSIALIKIIDILFTMTFSTAVVQANA